MVTEYHSRHLKNTALEKLVLRAITGHFKYECPLFPMSLNNFSFRNFLKQSGKFGHITESLRNNLKYTLVKQCKTVTPSNPQEQTR